MGGEATGRTQPPIGEQVPAAGLVPGGGCPLPTPAPLALRWGGRLPTADTCAARPQQGGARRTPTNNESGRLRWGLRQLGREPLLANAWLRPPPLASATPSSSTSIHSALNTVTAPLSLLRCSPLRRCRSRAPLPESTSIANSVQPCSRCDGKADSRVINFHPGYINSRLYGGSVEVAQAFRAPRRCNGSLGAINYRQGEL